MKIPIFGFLSTCLKCKSQKVKIEVRQDGVDFLCQSCGNKMLLRPGESFTIQVPQDKINKKMNEKQKEFDNLLDKADIESVIGKKEEEVKKPQKDEHDWADRVIDEWLDKQEKRDEN